MVAAKVQCDMPQGMANSAVALVQKLLSKLSAVRDVDLNAAAACCSDLLH